MAITTKKTTKTTKTKVAPKKEDGAVEKLRKENAELKVRVAELEKAVSSLGAKSSEDLGQVDAVDASEVRRLLSGAMARPPIVDKEVRASGLKALLWG